MHAVADYNQKLMDKRRHEIPKLAGKNLYAINISELQGKRQASVQQPKRNFYKNTNMNKKYVLYHYAIFLGLSK